MKSLGDAAIKGKTTIKVGSNKFATSTFMSKTWWGQMAAHAMFRTALDVPWGASKYTQTKLFGVENYGYPAESIGAWMHLTYGTDPNDITSFATAPIMALGGYAAAQTTIQYNVNNFMISKLEKKPFWYKQANKPMARLLYGKAYHDGHIVPASRGKIASKMLAINLGTYAGWSAYDFAKAISSDKIWERYDGNALDRIIIIAKLYGPTGDMGPTLFMFTNAGHIGGNIGELVYETLTSGKGNQVIVATTSKINDSLAISSIARNLEDPNVKKGFVDTLRNISKNSAASDKSLAFSRISTPATTLAKVEFLAEKGNNAAENWKYIARESMDVTSDISKYTETKLKPAYKALDKAIENGDSKTITKAAQNARRRTTALLGKVDKAAQQPFIKYRPEHTTNTFGAQLQAMADDLKTTTKDLDQLLTKAKLGNKPLPAPKIWQEGYKPNSKPATKAHKTFGWLRSKAPTFGSYATNIAGNVGAIYLMNYIIGDLLYEEFIPWWHTPNLQEASYEIDFPETSSTTQKASEPQTPMPNKNITFGDSLKNEVTYPSK